MLNQPRPFEDNGTSELLTDQVLRENAHENTQPFKRIRTLSFSWKTLALALIAILTAKWLIPDLWPLTALIALLVVLNAVLDAL